jgi:hypothetical protein
MLVRWHIQNLSNQERHLERLALSLARAQLAYDSGVVSYDKARGQIIRATNEGKESFDADRYMP